MPRSFRRCTNTTNKSSCRGTLAKQQEETRDMKVRDNPSGIHGRNYGNQAMEGKPACKEEKTTNKLRNMTHFRKGKPPYICITHFKVFFSQPVIFLNPSKKGKVISVRKKARGKFGLRFRPSSRRDRHFSLTPSFRLIERIISFRLDFL